MNTAIANKVKSLQIEQMKNKDNRVKLMNEILSGIKVKHKTLTYSTHKYTNSCCIIEYF